MTQVWSAAVYAEHRHLDGIAILIATGCRPQEAAEVTAEAWQAWWRLVLADDVDGSVRHLGTLADAAAGGVARIGARCSPAALSMAVSALGIDAGLSRRVGAYDIRHQRCVDAQVAFDRDPPLLTSG